MDGTDLAAAIEDVDRASATLYSNGQSEHVTVPKPLRGRLRWKKREALIVILENEDTIRVVSLTRHMHDVIEDDRRRRSSNGEAGR